MNRLKRRTAFCNTTIRAQIFVFFLKTYSISDWFLAENMFQYNMLHLNK